MGEREWKEVRLGDICNINKNSYSSTDNWRFINYLDTGNITENRIDKIQYLDIRKDKIPSRAKRKIAANDILYSTVRPNQKHYGIIETPLENMLVSTGFAVITGNKDRIENKYLYYYLTQQNIVDMLHTIGEHSTSAYPSIKPGDIENINILLPPLPEQIAIAATLSCLDDRIELNNRINRTLEEIAQAIFKSWFVDFEPFQDGEFEDSELGKIPKGWRVGILDDIIELFDSMRIPLSRRERETMKKTYPYYGATSLMDYVDDYIFDGIYVLLGEDGTVVDNSGYPILQYVWGQFWVNNHAHVLKGKNGFNEDSIYMLLKNTNLQGIVTGAVQPKINQANLKSVKVIIPAHDVIARYNYLLEPLFAKKRDVLEENQILESVRDTLLPKLMSGEIRVPIEEVTTNKQG